MEKESKNLSKTYLGLILVVISLIGIPFTILYPFIAYNPIQLILGVVFVIGMINLTKGLIENKSKKAYWLPFMLAGILTTISLFTQESYNDLFFYSTQLPDVSWLWDLEFASYFQLAELFYLVLVIIAALGIIFISVISATQFENIIKYFRFLKTFANFLIVSSACLYFSKMVIHPSFYPTIVFHVAPGFALVGPFFMGVMIKYVLKIYRKNLEFPQDEYQTKRNKIGYASTIVGGYIIIILSDLLEAIGRFILSDATLIFNQTLGIIGASLAFLSVFCALFYPKSGVILLLITGLIVAIGIFVPLSTLIIYITGSNIPLALLIVLLIANDLHKTRKLVKLIPNK